MTFTAGFSACPVQVRLVLVRETVNFPPFVPEDEFLGDALLPDVLEEEDFCDVFDDVFGDPFDDVFDDPFDDVFDDPFDDVFDDPFDDAFTILNDTVLLPV